MTAIINIVIIIVIVSIIIIIVPYHTKNPELVNWTI